MLAVGMRCRAMLHAAHGDLNTATATAELAITQHQRLPMPFEQAGTELLLGQLQRRQRRRNAATTTLREAQHTFEKLGTTLWAQRASAELTQAPRADAGPRPHAIRTTRRRTRRLRPDQPRYRRNTVHQPQNR